MGTSGWWLLAISITVVLATSDELELGSTIQSPAGIGVCILAATFYGD